MINVYHKSGANLTEISTGGAGKAAKFLINQEQYSNSLSR